MTPRVASITLLLACVLSAQLRAQERLAVSGYVELGTMQLAAAQTFDAVFGSHRASIVGGGGQLSNIWRGLFVDIGLSAISKNGERVSLNGGDVVALGVPLTVRMRHLDVAAGWRHAFGRLTPYASAGMAHVTYIESDPSEPVDLVNTQTGPLVVAGLDVSIMSWVRIGAELRGRRVRGILGASGASAHFGERSAGGVSTAMRLSVGR